MRGFMTYHVVLGKEMNTWTLNHLTTTTSNIHFVIDSIHYCVMTSLVSQQFLTHKTKWSEPLAFVHAGMTTACFMSTSS